MGTIEGAFKLWDATQFILDKGVNDKFMYIGQLTVPCEEALETCEL
jgi:hypothetical protein